MEKEDINKILNAAVRAPSGENCQPWSFVVKGNTIFIYNIPDRDRSPYNFHQYGSLVSHGAVVENIIIAASSLGYAAEISLFPLPAEIDCTAAITFAKSSTLKKEDLFNSIELRASNRTAYDASHAVSDAELKYLTDRAEEAKIGARLILVSDEEKKKKIGEALSYGDRLLFENRTIHDFLFNHIYWSKQEVLDKRSGFYVKELALTPPQEFIFKLLQNEFIRRLLVAMGLPTVAARDNAILYRQSSLFGAVIINEISAKNFIEAGRLVERSWLAITKLGYDMQLITAIPFFHQRILGNEANDFSENQIRGIEDAYRVLVDELALSEGTIVVMFRAGKGKPLPHRSLRMDPLVTFTHD